MLLCLADGKTSGDFNDLGLDECFSSINTNGQGMTHHKFRVQGEKDGPRVLNEGVILKYCNRALQLTELFFTHFLCEMGKKQRFYSKRGSQRCNTNSSNLTGTHRHVSSDFMKPERKGRCGERRGK